MNKRPSESRNRNERWIFVIVLLVVLCVIVSCVTGVVSLATRGAQHQATLNAIASANCASLKCESPIERFVIGQVTKAVGAGNETVVEQQCATLESLEASSPSKVTSDAISRFCTAVPASP